MKSRSESLPHVVSAALATCCAMTLGGIVMLDTPQVANAETKAPAKVTIKSAKLVDGKLTVKVKKAKKAKGYQYKITAKGFSTSTKSKKTTYSVSLGSIKTAKVRVRAYSGKKYGKWSKAKTVSAKNSNTAGNKGIGWNNPLKTVNGVTCQLYKCGNECLIARFTNSNSFDVSVDAGYGVSNAEEGEWLAGALSANYIRANGGQAYYVSYIDEEDKERYGSSEIGSIEVRRASDEKKRLYAAHPVTSKRNADGSIDWEMEGSEEESIGASVGIVYLDAQGNPIWYAEAEMWAGIGGESGSVDAPLIPYSDYALAVSIW